MLNRFFRTVVLLEALEKKAMSYPLCPPGVAALLGTRLFLHLQRWQCSLLLSSLPYTHPHITVLPTSSLLAGTPCLHRSANPRWPPFPRSFPQPHLWRPLCHKITYSPGLCVRMKTSFGTQLWGVVNSAYQSLGKNIAKRTTWKDRVSL